MRKGHEQRSLRPGLRVLRLTEGRVCSVKWAYGAGQGPVQPSVSPHGPGLGHGLLGWDPGEDTPPSYPRATSLQDRGLGVCLPGPEPWMDCKEDAAVAVLLAKTAGAKEHSAMPAEQGPSVVPRRQAEPGQRRWLQPCPCTTCPGLLGPGLPLGQRPEPHSSSSQRQRPWAWKAGPLRSPGVALHM